MTHSHGHLTGSEDHGRRGLATVLAVVVGLIAVTLAIGVWVLWPDGDDVAKAPNPYGTQGVSIVSGTVTDVRAVDCGGGAVGPDGLPAVQGECGELLVRTTDDESATVTVQPAVFRSGVEVGDAVDVIRIQPEGAATATYEFLDFDRGMPLVWLALACAVVIVAVARWRGLLAIGGVVATVGAIVVFVLPALLAGENPLVVAVVGSSAIMLVVLYLVHGVSIRTTAALFGTFIGIALTAVLGWLTTDWTHLTGISSEDDQILMAIADQISLSGVVTASMVIAGLGVLNDVTVTQASAVWELRAAQPAASRRRTFVSAMRIGRDHIASSVYTLVFAYAGTATTVLLLVTAYDRSLLEIASTEQVGAEIARTLVGLIGLVLAVPATTAIAVYLAPPPTEPADTLATAGQDPQLV
ncbi:YibE/F family protein [Mumia zhuanghuii]|uniref:YibE/F family protein n=2 Tax=Mumia TaxID=1546255 RepID=A0ABW1QHA3_9ACTN|nr:MULTISPECIES: YibE/F family protein [Mumia]KAA1422690.1 YibE/F family protein [Mumia zhuanghuii]